MSVTDLLINAGRTVLSENKMPTATDFNLTVSNANTGMNLVLMGLAQRQADHLLKVAEATELLEGQLTAPEAINSMTLHDRMALLDQLHKSFDQRTRFIKMVREDVDSAKLNLDMINSDPKVRVSAPTGVNPKVVREILTKKVTETYTVGKQAQEIPEAEVETEVHIDT